MRNFKPREEQAWLQLQKMNDSLSLFISDNFNLGTGVLIVIHFKMYAGNDTVIDKNFAHQYSAGSSFLEDQLQFLESNWPGKQKCQYFATKGITEKKIPMVLA